MAFRHPPWAMATTKSNIIQLVTTKEVPGRLLDKSLTFKDRHRLFQACNFRFTAGLAFCIWLGLCNAHLLQLVQALQDGSELIGDRREICGQLCDGLVETCCLLCLVLDILGFRNVAELIFLHVGLIFRSGGLLLRSHLCEPLGEIAFANLQESNDAAACTFSGAMAVICSIVLLQHFQSLLDAVDAHRHLSAVLLEGGILACSQLVSLSLGLGHASKLVLQSGNFALQLG